MKSGLQQLMGSMLPGFDVEAMQKAANQAGEKILAVEAAINRIEQKTDYLIMICLKIEAQTLSQTAAGETPMLTAKMMELEQ